jgi:glycosyltransferase involved in cell wall biosynthesis
MLASQGVRRADGVRTLSNFTSQAVREEGVEPTGTFPAFMDLESFLETPPAPLPDPPVAVFVGVLERYKGADVLAQAWRLAAPQVPSATLHLVGRGTMRGVANRLVAELPRQTRWTESLETDGVVQALDDATVLLLPSRSEGLPRVIIEAACRGRAVVASGAGGIPDLITHGENGLLVPPGDAEALANALVHVLSDEGVAESLGAAAHRAVQPWLATPEEYARRVRDLVESVDPPARSSTRSTGIGALRSRLRGARVRTGPARAV